MANDEIRDLMGRYATGSLSADEQQRLFDAALDDQDLFDELAREQELKSLIDEPGARDRLIRALEPPKRKVSWIFALVPVAVAVVFVILFVYPDRFRKPSPQSTVATATTAVPQTEIASAGKPAAEQPVSEPRPAATPLVRDKASEPPPKALEKKAEGREEEDRRTLDRKEETKKDTAKDQVAAAPPPPPAAPPPPPKEKQAAEAKSTTESEQLQVQAVAPQVQRYDAQQQKAQNAPGGPRQQNAVQQPAARKAQALPVAGASAGLLTLPPFGFHYSVETPGHLIIIPAGDGTLSVKSADGTVLFAPQRIAVGITNDIALPDSVSSVTMVFSRGATAPQITPSVRTDPQGDVTATSASVTAVAIDLKINR
jgi:hypothetical protein